MYVGVIEWASDSLRLPTVIVADAVDDVLRQVGGECKGFTFDGGGEIDAIRDRFDPHMDGEQLRDWFGELWDASTDCALTVYEVPTVGLPRPFVLGDGQEVSWR